MSQVDINIYNIPQDSIRQLPKPKPPDASSSSVLNFTDSLVLNTCTDKNNKIQSSSVIPSKKYEVEQSKKVLREEDWKLLRDIQRQLTAGNEERMLEYATKREILDLPQSMSCLSGFLLEDKIVNQENSVSTFFQKRKNIMSNICKKANLKSDKKRSEKLMTYVREMKHSSEKSPKLDALIISNLNTFEVYKEIEPLEKEQIQEIKSSPAPLPLISTNISSPNVMTRFSSLANTPFFKAFERSIKKKSSLTPRGNQFGSSTPTTSRRKSVDENILTKENEINEQELLNSLGLKSLDDLFADLEEPMTPVKTQINEVIEETERSNPIVITPVKATSNIAGVLQEQKLEFINLENIFGDSDDDLFANLEDSPIYTSKKSSSLNWTENNVKSPKCDKISEQNSSTPRKLFHEPSPAKHTEGTSVLHQLEEEIDRLSSSIKDVKMNLSFDHNDESVEVDRTKKTIILQETSPSLMSRCYSYSKRLSCISRSQLDTTPDKSLITDVKSPPVISPLTQIIRPVMMNNKKRRHISSDSEDDDQIKNPVNFQNSIEQNKTVS